MRKLERELRRLYPAAKLEVTHGGHLRLRLPNGKMVHVSSTPGCQSFLDRVRADVGGR